MYQGNNELTKINEINIDAIDAIKEEVDKFLKEQKSNGAVDHGAVLNHILNELELNALHYEDEQDVEPRLSHKAKVVRVVKKVLQCAEKLKLGLRVFCGGIYCYNGEFWMHFEKEQLMNFLGAAAIKMGVDNITGSYFAFRESLLKQFYSEAYQLPQPERPDSILINLQNGTFQFDAEGFELRDFDKEDFLTYQLPFKYDPLAECPIWQAFLDQVLPEKDKEANIVDEGKSRQRILAEYIAYAFTAFKCSS